MQINVAPVDIPVRNFTARKSQMETKFAGDQLERTNRLLLLFYTYGIVIVRISFQTVTLYDFDVLP